MTRWMIVSLACLLALVACGRPAEAPPEAPAGAGFPVTVTGKLGAATIPAQPVRVVATDWTSADIALALGVVPVAAQRVRLGTDTGIQPWAQEKLGGAPAPQLFGTDQGDPIETIAAARPDVILATKDYNLDTDYAALSAIAPVVHYAAAPNADSWQDTTRAIAAALGKVDEGEQLITDTQNRIAEARDGNAALGGRTFSFLVGPTDTGVYAVNSADDVSARFLTELGLTLSPATAGLPTSSIPGRAQLSYEEIGRTDADLVVATGSAAALGTLTAQPGFAALSAATAGRYVALSPTEAQAIAFPSPLSLDWAVARVVPRLAEAAGR
ncbi:iron-siderophore ABC transporter substrate-binding protein [Pseudonocardia halophobica]|nr:iron-siderophore ABC transporter substrate-binding protein [Pseudonocardia halophobica]